jgi:hypothetical protein
MFGKNSKQAELSITVTSNRDDSFIEQARPAKFAPIITTFFLLPISSSKTTPGNARSVPFGEFERAAHGHCIP